MKRVARLAFDNGLMVGMNSVAALFNGLYAVGSALHGDVIMALASYVVAVVSGVVAWRAWQKHRRGLANLGGA